MNQVSRVPLELLHLKITGWIHDRTTILVSIRKEFLQNIIQGTKKTSSSGNDFYLYFLPLADFLLVLKTQKEEKMGTQNYPPPMKTCSFAIGCFLGICGIFPSIADTTVRYPSSSPSHLEKGKPFQLVFDKAVVPASGWENRRTRN